MLLEKILFRIGVSVMPGKPEIELMFVLLDEAADEVRLAVPQADDVVDLPGAENR